MITNKKSSTSHMKAKSQRRFYRWRMDITSVTQEKVGFPQAKHYSPANSIRHFALGDGIRRGMTAAMRDADMHRADATLLKHFASTTA
jgi:hypothetical protein